MNKILENVEVELRVVIRQNGNTADEIVISDKKLLDFNETENFTLIQQDNREDRVYLKVTVWVDGKSHTTDVHLQGY